MSKAVIKIIKRYKEIVLPPQILDKGEKTKINIERGTADTVSVWISDCHKNKRAEKVSALDKISAWKNNSEVYSGHS